jgi:hypothetical protein
MVDATLPITAKRSLPDGKPPSFRIRALPITPSTPMSDATLRTKILSLSLEQLQSTTIRLTQFNAAAKSSLASLIPANNSPVSMNADDETVRTKLFIGNVENCKYWLSDKWYAQHPSLPPGFACQVSRTAVRKEVSDIMRKARPDDFILGRGHGQCTIVLDAIVALIEIVIDILGREGTPSGRCRADRSLAEHIGDQLGEFIYRSSVFTKGTPAFAHEDCMWEHVLVASDPMHPTRRAIGQMVQLPPSPSHSDLYVFRTLGPTLKKVAEDVIYYCKTGTKRAEDEVIPDFGDVSLSASESDDSDEEVDRPVKRR